MKGMWTMANEVRLIGCRSCDSKNCSGCNLLTLEDMLCNGDFDCLMDESKSIVAAPESLRPKGRWELHGNDDDCGCSYFCSNCYRSYPEEWFWDHGKYVPFENCPHCTAKMEG